MPEITDVNVHCVCGCVCVEEGVCVQITATWVGLYSRALQALRSCSYELRDNADRTAFLLPPGYRSVWGSSFFVLLGSATLSHFSLSDSNFPHHKSNFRRVCVRACWNSVPSGHNVITDGYWSLWVHVQDFFIMCVCVCPCSGESCLSCERAAWCWCMCWTYLRCVSLLQKCDFVTEQTKFLWVYIHFKPMNSNFSMW